jgi:hypothetical protein
MQRKQNKMTKSNFNLEIGKYLKDCDSNDVIASSSKSLLYINRLCDLILSSLDRDLNRYLAKLINQKISIQWKPELWLDEGEECEILKANSLGWQKGKIKLKVNFTLEFIPDEPEVESSPLDDVRQQINKNNIN